MHAHNHAVIQHLHTSHTVYAVFVLCEADLMCITAHVSCLCFAVTLIRQRVLRQTMIIGAVTIQQQRSDEIMQCDKKSFMDSPSNPLPPLLCI